MTNNDFFNQGWNEVNTGVETKKIVVTFREDDRDYEMIPKHKRDDIIRGNLQNQLVKCIRDSNYIKYSKRKDPGFEQYTEYSAEVAVADCIFDNTVVGRREFYFHDRIWTEKEIKEALIQTFAHEMI